MKKEEYDYDYMRRLGSWSRDHGLGGAELARRNARKAIEGKSLKDCIMILVKACKQYARDAEELVVAAEIVEKAHLWCLRAENHNRKLLEFVRDLGNQSENGDWLPPASTWDEDGQPDFNACYSHLAEICHKAKKLTGNEDETN